MTDRLHRQHEGLSSNLLDLQNQISNKQCFDFIASEVDSKLSVGIAAARRHRDRKPRLWVSAFDLICGAVG